MVGGESPLSVVWGLCTVRVDSLVDSSVEAVLVVSSQLCSDEVGRLCALLITSRFSFRCLLDPVLDVGWVVVSMGTMVEGLSD